MVDVKRDKRSDEYISADNRYFHFITAIVGVIKGMTSCSMELTLDGVHLIFLIWSGKPGNLEVQFDGCMI